MSEGSEVRRLVRMLMSQQSRIESLERAVTAPQMTFSSIDDGTIVEKDAAGEVVARVGKQPDGTHGVVDYHGPTPPAPSAPAVEGGPGLLTVTWDGTLTLPRPLDLARVEAYAAPAPFEYLEEADLLGSITGRDGGRLTVTRTPGTWHVALVAVSRAEKRSVFSALAVVEVLEAGDSEAVERLAKAFHTDTRPPGPEDVEGRPEGAYWTMIDETGAEAARWRLVDGEWVDAPLSPDFIPEAYVDRLAANQGLIQELLTHNVDVAGHLRLAGSLYAQQETYGLEVTAEGLDMSSQGLTYLGDRWFLPGAPESLSVLGGHLVTSREDGGRWNRALAIFAPGGELVREIHADDPHTLGLYHYVDTVAEVIWTQRLQQSTGDPGAPVDIVGYDLQGDLVATIPVAQETGHTLAVSDDYLIHQADDAEMAVRDRSGALLRTIQFPEGERYDPTAWVIDGDTLYDFRGNLTRFDLTTGDVIDQTPLPGRGGTPSRSGGDLIIPVLQFVTGANYLAVYNIASNSITSLYQLDLGGNKDLRCAVRVGGDLHVLTDQDGLTSVEAVNVFQNQQTQASIDTITGGVRFNNPILTGVTKTDVTAADHLISSTRDYITVRDRLVSQYGHNWFVDEAERDSLLPRAWAGTEAVTYSGAGGTAVWRMGRNQQWVRVWSEGYDQGPVFLPSLPGWNVGESYYEVRSGWAFLAIDLQRTGSALGSGNNPLWTLPQEALPTSHLFTNVMNQSTRENLLLEISTNNGVIGLITPTGAVSTNHRIRRFTSWPIAT